VKLGTPRGGLAHTQALAISSIATTAEPVWRADSVRTLDSVWTSNEEAATLCAGKLPRSDSLPEATIQHGASPVRCDIEEKTQVDQTASTVEGTSPSILDLPQGIFDKLEIPALVDPVSAKEQPAVKFCMESQPTISNEAACIDQPEPEQEVPASGRDFENHDTAKMVIACPNELSRQGYEVHGDTKMVQDVTLQTASEVEEVESRLAPQSRPSVRFDEIEDMLEPESDAKSLEAKVSTCVDMLFEMHGQACVDMAMTCKRHPLWRLHPPGRRFKVTVPEPHPGLTYRLTKRLHDRAGEQVEKALNGDEVEGRIEECGLWLLVEMPRSNGMTTHYYLPMRVGNHQLLKEIDPITHQCA